MKMILMNTSAKFKENDKMRLSKLTNLPFLHVAAEDKFSILDYLQNSNDTALIKVKKLNNKIAKESLFSFSLYAIHTQGMLVMYLNYISNGLNNKI